MRIQFIIPLLAFSLTIPIVALAEPPDRPRHRGSGGSGISGMAHPMPGRFLDNPDRMAELQLSEQQIESIRQIRFKAQKDHIAFQAEAAQARLVIQNLLSQDQPLEGELMSAIEKAGQVKIAMRKSHVQRMLKIRELIGSENWQKLREHGRRNHGQRRRQPKHEDQSGIRF